MLHMQNIKLRLVEHPYNTSTREIEAGVQSQFWVHDPVSNKQGLARQLGG